MTRIAMAIVLFGVAGCATQPRPKVYEVRYLREGHISIDGSLKEPAWKNASVLKDFSLPWEKRPAPLTEFRAVRDDATFYFSFVVVDSDIVVAEAFDSESVVDGEDRVEIFMACDAELKRYYGLEIDPRGRVHDYAATFYRKFDSSWNCPGLRTAASFTTGGYIVEGSIPLQTLRSLGLWSGESGSTLRAGVFRAEFCHGPGAAPEEHWISWINPRTAKPDFHVPSAFGCFRITGPKPGR
jgi:hypothetical protein